MIRHFAMTLAGVLLLSAPAAAQSIGYLAMSFGTSIEAHQFDTWNGPAAPGRRALTGRSNSSDQAIAWGMRDAMTIRGRSFDAEFEIFERRSLKLTASGAAGDHATSIRTTSMLLGLWTDLHRDRQWAVQAGAGLGARFSHYRMTGPSIAIDATDRAPYAMAGLRLLRKTANPGVNFFADLRVHARPRVRLKAPGSITSPLEHESNGLTLRLGLQFDLGRKSR